MEIINVGPTKVDPITEKYIQVNSIIKEIEQMLIKTHILEWNSIDFNEYGSLYKDTRESNFHEVLNFQTGPLITCHQTMKYLSDNRDPGIFYVVWCPNYDGCDFQLSPIANKEHLSELFDEYITVLTFIKKILISKYHYHVYFEKYIYDNITDCINTITEYINPMKFIVKDLYLNHPDYNYKFEAKYYLDKINELIKQNEHSEYVWEVIEGHFDKIDKCLSGQEVIMRIQTCYDKIYNYYNGDKLISHKNEKASTKYRHWRKTKEMREYVNEVYNTIEKEREYMINSWRKIDMMVTKLYYELNFYDDVSIYEEEDSELIGNYLKIIYETIRDNQWKRERSDVIETIISIIEENQKKIMGVISKYAFQCYYEDVDDSYERWYDTFPQFNKKYLSPIRKMVKWCVDLERFH